MDSSTTPMRAPSTPCLFMETCMRWRFAQVRPVCRDWCCGFSHKGADPPGMTCLRAHCWIYRRSKDKTHQSLEYDSSKRASLESDRVHVSGSAPTMGCGVRCASAVTPREPHRLPMRAPGQRLVGALARAHARSSPLWVPSADAFASRKLRTSLRRLLFVFVPRKRALRRFGRVVD